MFANKPFLVGDIQCCVFKFMWHLQASRKSQMMPVLKTASNCPSVKPPRFSFQTKPTHHIQTQTSQRPLQLLSTLYPLLSTLYSPLSSLPYFPRRLLSLTLHPVPRGVDLFPSYTARTEVTCMGWHLASLEKRQLLVWKRAGRHEEMHLLIRKNI